MTCVDRCAVVVALACLAVPVGGQEGAGRPELNAARIEKLTGLKGTSFPDEGVFKVTSPTSSRSTTT